jgi:membrane-bound lytic murein transglycosylase B
MAQIFLLFPLLFTLAQPALAQGHNAKPFGLWMAQLKDEARAQGVSQATLDEALKDVAPLDDVVDLDRKQPESKLTLQEYLAKVITDQRIEEGKSLLAEHRDVLDKVSSRYGVPPNIIVALWGIETSYGENTGNFEVVTALATLAYD